ncbi:MAG TPA: DUF1080 domain-containing protein, partial [Pirellulaceae bacterium]
MSTKRWVGKACRIERRSRSYPLPYQRPSVLGSCRRGALTNRWLLVLCGLLARTGLAQDSWRQHDTQRPRPPVVTPGEIDRPAPAPSDAIVLFDGTDLSRWQAPGGGETKWKVSDGTMCPTPGAGTIETKDPYGDVQLHLEWQAPLPAVGNGQGRGNSGVWFMSRYEFQILDSYKNETYADGQAAAIYGQDPPLVNASLPPGKWQAYDVVFRAPAFDRNGAVKRPASITAFHNGLLVQDHRLIQGRTDWLRLLPYEAHADKEPLGLQDHGNPILFRNIWIRELASEDVERPTTRTHTLATYPSPSPSELDGYVGSFQVADAG